MRNTSKWGEQNNMSLIIHALDRVVKINKLSDSKIIVLVLKNTLTAHG